MADIQRGQKGDVGEALLSRRAYKPDGQGNTAGQREQVRQVQAAGTGTRRIKTKVAFKEEEVASVRSASDSRASDSRASGIIRIQPEDRADRTASKSCTGGCNWVIDNSHTTNSIEAYCCSGCGRPAGARFAK
jgi:hypothetical protein